MSESYAASCNRFAIFAMGGEKSPACWKDKAGPGDSQPASVARPWPTLDYAIAARRWQDLGDATV